jgi:L-lactate dehydrogenase complex protein LldG
MDDKYKDWRVGLLPAKFGDHLFGDFEIRAKDVSAEVFRAETLAEAGTIIVNLVKSVNAKKVVVADGSLQRTACIVDKLKSEGISVYSDPSDIRSHIENADVGISGVEFGIAETGSIFQNASAIEDRLVSTLPPVHIALMNSGSVVSDIDDVLDIISRSFEGGYISFITGPSRTADIERVLTIGVHGPSRLVIIAVDEEVA